jgi:DNA-binding NtrC family response regulator
MNEMPHILLVEDDDSTRELIEEILVLEGYKITSAINGLEAKELLQKEKFNLLITDFKMPGLNGLELLAWCNEEKIKSPMIFMTAETNLIPEESAALSNSQAIIIQKPLNLVLFFNSIKKMLHLI